MLLDAPLLSRLSHKRLMATFQVEAQRGEQDLYRCVTLSSRGAAISNFGELIVRGKLDFGQCDKYLQHMHHCVTENVISFYFTPTCHRICRHTLPHMLTYTQFNRLSSSRCFEVYTAHSSKNAYLTLSDLINNTTALLVELIWSPDFTW